MLATKQNVLRRFWYATVRLDDLAAGPRPFTLLGERIVLFLGADGQPAALEDRCPHRTARLSLGWCDKGRVICGYHGWEFDSEGHLARIPQFTEGQALPNAQIRKFHAQARYGYVWVALEQPLADIPAVPEDEDPAFRRIYQHYGRWECSALRLMENSFDQAHIAFVHKGTFGEIDRPRPTRYAIEETDEGFWAETEVRVANPPRAHRVTGDTGEWTVRTMRNAWYMPFCRRLDITYPSGRRHIIFNCATPIDDGAIQVTQLLFRNDTEADCPEQELIDWDAEVLLEDRTMLESTDPDAVLDLARKAEMHMPSDHPGLIMRKRLLALLAAHGEEEVAAA
ncbi:MAG TPA: aromatic ring-hydroxylating dioxygenase subunit alpha [Novosphingobium sp.]|nr:aromatic ring-hydroxylating dioxygenase subunit alpha [Novosphingobium sp.]